MQTMKLIVAESMDSELSGFARIHERVMKDLGIEEDGVIEIEFEGRRVKATAMPHLGAENVVRIGRSLRELLGVKIGDSVFVRSSSVVEAEEVVVSEILDEAILSLLSGRIVHAKERIRVGSRIIEILECIPERIARLSERTRVIYRKD